MDSKGTKLAMSFEDEKDKIDKILKKSHNKNWKMFFL